MSRAQLPPEVRRALGALERRLFRVLVTFGLGRAAWKGCALLLLVFALDRWLAPPTAARLTLAAAALGLWLWHVRRDLLLPMRRRPAARDLAAWWERSTPELGDLLATTVDLAEAASDPTRGSVDFRAEIARQAAEAARDLEARSAVPSRRARRSLHQGGLAVALILALIVWQPQQAWIFAQRLLGRDLPWPSEVRLVLLPLHAEGADSAVPLEEIGPESFRCALARGSVALVRIRAEGVVPDRVTVEGWGGGARAMTPAGAEEFVLRLPPVEEAMDLSFRGGDDRDGRPALRIEVGDAPVVIDWWVRTEPPDYAGLPVEESAAFEWRVLRGTRLQVSFRADRPVREARAERLDGGEVPVQLDADGRLHFELEADRSDQVAVALTGADGFVRRRAAVLRWEAEQDRPPQLRITFPGARWTSVPGATVPLAYSVEDDFGLAALTLTDFAGISSPLPTGAGAPARQVLRLTVPAPGSAEALTEARLQAELVALDDARPAPQTVRAQTPWIEVVPPNVFDPRQAERIVRVREEVGSLRDRLTQAMAGTDPWSTGFGRRLRRDLEGLVAGVEFELLTRLWSDLDEGTAPHAAAMEPAMQTERPAAGAWVDALHASGLTRPAGRSGLLADLAEALLSARRGSAQDLEEALAAGQDPLPAARALVAELDRILEILTVWEDYQSALNLLRDLIQRQREIHLRTREVSGR